MTFGRQTRVNLGSIHISSKIYDIHKISMKFGLFQALRKHIPITIQKIIILNNPIIQYSYNHTKIYQLISIYKLQQKVVINLTFKRLPFSHFNSFLYELRLLKICYKKRTVPLHFQSVWNTESKCHHCSNSVFSLSSWTSRMVLVSDHVADEILILASCQSISVWNLISLQMAIGVTVWSFPFFFFSFPFFLFYLLFYYYYLCTIYL